MRRYLYIIIAIALMPMAASARYAALQSALDEYVKGKDARIGVAVIFDNADTVQVNGGRDFPMLSVYKFPQAVALSKIAIRRHIDIDDYAVVTDEDLRPDTWSPMRDKYDSIDIAADTLLITIGEILNYSLAYSDNNACDIIFGLIGSPVEIDSIIKSMGYNDIHIVNTEAEMHVDPYLCYQNRSTPIAMARLFDDYYRLGYNKRAPIWWYIDKVLTECKTGLNRLAKPLPEGVKLAHKTGTGDRNSQGRIIGINDTGYVFMPDGRGYAIAVFVADSAYDTATTEQIIADISRMVYSSYTEELVDS